MLLGSGSWKGSYFVSNYDEPAYSAYVSALINGEPRKNDPFLGLADSSETPQPETLYSIQFIPPYAIAIPARILGLSATTSFIILMPLMAFISFFAIRRLIMEATGDEIAGAVGPLIVLFFGTAVAFQGELRFLIEGRVLTDFLPFLRRYQPGLSFPLFFIFCLFAVRSVRSDDRTRNLIYAAAAGGVFAVLVFSYFYLWTAAAAWFGLYLLLGALLDRERLMASIRTAAVVSAIGIAALIPYFYLLGQRSPNLDSVQLLAFTRMPILDSPSMIFGLIVAGASILLLKRAGNSRKLLFVLSLALTPVVLFNQQLITGRSLQPVHYELFIANYLVLTAAVVLVFGFLSARDSADGSSWLKKAAAYAGIAAFAWGIFEAYGSTSRNMTPAAIRDASYPVLQAASQDNVERPVVLATNFVTADIIPSIGDLRPLWNPHSSSAGGIDVEQNKRLFRQFLYLSGFSPQELEAALREGSFEVTAAVFGSERALPALSGGAAAILDTEIRSAVADYAKFVNEMDDVEALKPVLTHVIVPAKAEPDLRNLDRWYTRDAGRDLGLFRLYRVSPRSAP